MQTLTKKLKQQAHEQGFELVGVTGARPPVGLDRFLDWLEQGYAGQMQYLEKGLLPVPRLMRCYPVSKAS